MVGDYFIFQFMKDRVFAELMPLASKLQTPRMKVLFKSPYFAWILPVVGAFVIASPLPDEVGVSMMGLSKVKQWQFFPGICTKCRRYILSCDCRAAVRRIIASGVSYPST